MNCPLCVDQVLTVNHRSGIEVDICPKCKGVWLDRGELERLAESSDRPKARGARAPDVPVEIPNHSKKPKKRKKKKSLADRLEDVFEEILDF